MRKPHLFDDVLRNVGFAAADAAIAAIAAGETPNRVTQVSTEAAFKHAVLNGMITINDSSSWVEWQAVKGEFD